MSVVPHPLGATAVVTNEVWADMDPQLAMLAQDSNGDETYDNEKAMIGHLEAKFFLVIDKVTYDSILPAHEIKVDLEILGKKSGVNTFLGNTAEATAHKGANPYLNVVRGDTDPIKAARRIATTRITALNYASLREAGVESKAAFLMAALRARWVITGALSVTKEDDGVGYNEILVVEDSHPTFGLIVDAVDSRDIINALGKYALDFATEYKSESHGMKYVIRHAENFWAAVEHCFRVRNHHFKDGKDFIGAFTDLFIRFLTSAYEGTFKWPEGIPMYNVFRLSIHPFKLKALPVMTVHYIVYGKVANAAITRTSGSPCGTAQITTAVAALDTMKGEAWWSAFKETYNESIEEAESFAAQINDDKYSYHISANLYGMKKKYTLKLGKKDITLDEAKSKVSIVASACQGMINALREAVANNIISRFALANSRALEKPAASNPLLCLRITFLIKYALNGIDDSDSIKDAIENALPQIKETAEEEEDERKSKKKKKSGK